MLSSEPSKLMDEVRAAEEARDRHLRDWDDVMSRYHGSGYRDDLRLDRVDPENHAFEWISLVVPQMVFSNPRVRVKTSRVGTQVHVAKALEFGLNRVIRDQNIRRLNEKLAVDYSLKWAVAITTREARPGLHEFEDPTTWPITKRISPRRFVWDYAALEPEDWRFQGHLMVRDKEDILREAKEFPERGWDKAAVQGLVEGGVNDRQDERRSNYDMNPDRGEVSYYEVYVPEHQLDGFAREDGYNGTIFTVAQTQTSGGDGARFLRKPRPYWGPRSGPYTVISGYTVPDEGMGLSPVAAVEAQSESLNNMTRAMYRNMDAYKKIIAVAGDQGDTAEKIAAADDLYVVAFENLDELRGSVQEIELGGITQQHAAMHEILRQNLDRNSGIHEAQRGNVSGAGTATELNIAAQASASRMGFVVQKFRDGVEEILAKMAWYLYHDDNIAFSLGPEAVGYFVDPKTGQPLEEPWFYGGGHSEQDGADFDSMELDIEPYSMERTSEAAQIAKFQQLTEFALSVIPAIPQFPYFDWTAYLRVAEDGLNIPGLSEMVDIEEAREFGEQMMQAPQGDGVFGGGTQPRVTRDLSSTGPNFPTGPSRNTAAQANKRSPGQILKQPEKKDSGLKKAN